jgi:hypothetical protein
MCYYSLEMPSRPAKEEEVLIVQTHPRGTKWLATPEDGETAVCLKDGLAVELLYIPADTQRNYRLKSEEKAIFKVRHWFRCDVLLTESRRRVLFQSLEAGQVLRILVQKPTQSALGSKGRSKASHSAKELTFN